MTSKNTLPSIQKVCIAVFFLWTSLEAASPKRAPAAPSSMAATAVSSSQINLTWTDNATNETGFKVERTTPSTGVWTEIVSLGAGQVSYADTGRASATAYSYRVRATNASGNSAYSNTASATTLGAVPAAPGGLAASAISSSQINLIWTDNSMNETGFMVERAPSSTGPWAQIGTTGASVVSYANTGVGAATTFYYRVRATNASGSSSYSNVVSATTSAGAPTAPSVLSATAISASQINLSFADNSSDETGFKVERAPSSTGTWVQIGTTGTNATSYADTTTTGSTTYYYRVSATGTAGDSAYSNTANATTPAVPTAPAAPTVLTATALSSSQINLSFTDNSANETGFKVERAPSSTGTWVQIGTTATNVASFADTTTVGSTTYTYRVRATNTVGDSAYSNTANATTPAVPTAPAAPSVLSATALSSSQINLSFADNSTNETGFKVERAPSSTGTWVQIGTTATNVASFADTTTVGSTTYYYRVRATNTVGDSTYSNTANATTPAVPTAPAAPSVLSATALSSSQINLSFADNSTNETGFKVERAPSSTGTWVQIGTTATNVASFADTTTVGSTTYYYRVRATNAVGDSAYSNTANATTPAVPTAPAAPSVLTATAISSSQINLSFTDNSANETGFKVERAPSSTGTWVQIGTTATNVASFADTTTVGSTTYYYRVRATNTVGDSAYSNTANATTPAVPTAPAAPSVLTATALSSSQINLSFTDNSTNETGFKVERAPSSTGTWVEIGTTATNVASYADTTVVGLTTYYYRVRATNAVGDSAYSNTASATTPATIAGGPVAWAAKYGAQVLTDASYVSAVAVDSAGSIFTAGRFTGTANLGGGSITSGLGYDIFVAKYDADGTYRWAKHFNSMNVQSKTSAMAIDGGGNVLVTGSFFNTLDFGAPCTPITAYSQDTFIVKLSTSGSCVWARSFTSNNVDGGSALAVDGSNNVVVAGGFQGTLDFGNSVILTGHSSSGQSDIYLAKFNSSGGIIWAHNFSGTTNNGQSVYDVAVDGSGNIAMTGSFQSTVDFCAPGPACPFTAAVNPVSGPSNDAFIVKYNPSGVAVWARSLGESQGGEQVGQAVAFDDAGNLLATGYAAGDLNFGLGVQRFIGAMDLFVLKIAPDGTTTWAKRFGSSGYEQYAFDLAVDANDDVIVAGKTAGPVDFGSGPLPNPDGFTGRTNALSLKLSSTGSFVWVKSSGDNWFQSARAVATDSSRNVIYAGVFASAINFGTTALSSPGTSTDSIFVTKVGP